LSLSSKDPLTRWLPRTPKTRTVLPGSGNLVVPLGVGFVVASLVHVGVVAVVVVVAAVVLAVVVAVGVVVAVAVNKCYIHLRNIAAIS
jgi:hypothetical protein